MENSGYKIVITSLVPRSIDFDGKSGAQVRLVEILKRLDRSNGLKITAISSDEVFFDSLRAHGIYFERISIKSNLKFKSLVGLCLKSSFILLKSLFLLKLGFLNDNDRKVIVYASSDLFWEVIPAFYFKMRKKQIKWVQVIHHVYPDWKTRSGGKITNFFGYYLQRFSFSLIRRSSDMIIVLNDHVKNELIGLGFQENMLSISSNGVDIDYVENIKESETHYDGIFLGRLSASKGIFKLIDIWKKVVEIIPQAKLAIIGGGNTETKKFLGKKIKNLNLRKNIDLLGYLKDKDVHSILKSGKVFLTPSHEEGWGIAIAEAMAAELPVVSWDLPVFKSVFENHTVQVEENNIEKFSSEIVRLLENEKLRKETGEKGKIFIKRYSWDEVAKEEVKIIYS